MLSNSFIEICFFDTQNTVHLTVKGLKDAFFIIFTPLLYLDPTIL